MSGADFFYATREIISEDNLIPLSIKPNFKHEDTCDFLLVLNRYFFEHGFEVTQELLKEKIEELTKHTLEIYHEHNKSSRIYEPARNKVYKPFNELEGEILVPTEGDGEIGKIKNERYKTNSSENQIGVVGNISISIQLERKVSEYNQKLSVFMCPALPDCFQSIDVSFNRKLFKHNFRLNSFSS